MQFSVKLHLKKQKQKQHEEKTSSRPFLFETFIIVFVNPRAFSIHFNPICHPHNTKTHVTAHIIKAHSATKSDFLSDGTALRQYRGGRRKVKIFPPSLKLQHCEREQYFPIVVLALIVAFQDYIVTCLFHRYWHPDLYYIVGINLSAVASLAFPFRPQYT